MTIGENIKRLRLKNGLTQVQLGKLCGLADSAIRRYENERANPKIETIQKIAGALGVDYWEIVEFNNINASNSQISDSTYLIEKKLNQIGYYIGGYEEDGYLWIEYPDGTLEVTESDLEELDQSSNSYLKFKLEELKQKHIKDFKPKK